MSEKTKWTGRPKSLARIKSSAYSQNVGAIVVLVKPKFSRFEGNRFWDAIALDPVFVSEHPIFGGVKAILLQPGETFALPDTDLGELCSFDSAK